MTTFADLGVSPALVATLRGRTARTDTAQVRTRGGGTTRVDDASFPLRSVRGRSENSLRPARLSIGHWS